MGLLNARNLRKAKSLLDQNRHKVGDLVGKATEQIDKVSKGKTSNVSAKVEEAARKYSSGGVGHHGAHPAANRPNVGANAPADPAANHPNVGANAPADGEPIGAEPGVGDAIDAAELQRRQAEATIAAADALKSAADAAAEVFNREAVRRSADPDDPPPPSS